MAIDLKYLNTQAVNAQRELEKLEAHYKVTTGKSFTDTTISIRGGVRSVSHFNEFMDVVEARVTAISEALTEFLVTDHNTAADTRFTEIETAVSNAMTIAAPDPGP